MSDSLDSLKLDERKSVSNKKDSNQFKTSRCSYAILGFLYLLISSDTFAEVVLSAFPGAVERAIGNNCRCYYLGYHSHYISHILIISYL